MSISCCCCCCLYDGTCDCWCCFPGNQNSVIALEDREKYIEDLHIGDVVKVYKDGGVQYSPVWQFAHQDPTRKTHFVQIDGETKRGMLTRRHYLYIEKENKMKSIMAKDIKNGDTIYILNEDGEVTKENVQNIEIVEGQGVYAPFTKEGNMFVNGILCSCYAEVKPSVAHRFLGLVRTAKRVLPSPVTKKVFKENKDGVPRILDAAHSIFKPIAVEKSSSD